MVSKFGGREVLGCVWIGGMHTDRNIGEVVDVSDDMPVPRDHVNAHIDHFPCVALSAHPAYSNTIKHLATTKL